MFRRFKFAWLFDLTLPRAVNARGWSMVGVNSLTSFVLRSLASIDLCLYSNVSNLFPAKYPKPLECFAAHEGIDSCCNEMFRLRSLPRVVNLSWCLWILAMNSGLILDFRFSFSWIASSVFLADASIALILSWKKFELPWVTRNDRLIFRFNLSAYSLTNLPLVSTTDSLNITLPTSDSLRFEFSLLTSISLICVLVLLRSELAKLSSYIFLRSDSDIRLNKCSGLSLLRPPITFSPLTFFM